MTPQVISELGLPVLAAVPTMWTDRDRRLAAQRRRRRAMGLVLGAITLAAAAVMMAV